MSVHPLLLLDNSSMVSLINQGEFKCVDITFDEAKIVLDNLDGSEMLRCFSDKNIELIIYDYLGIAQKEIAYKRIRDMRVGQNAIVFKLYATPSETLPIITTDKGNEAKKIQNIYVYCQMLSRVS